MAKPIKETPVLKGKDAKIFINNMKTSASKKSSLAERERIKANFLKISSISKI